MKRLLIVAASTLVFYLAVHEISGTWLDIALHPELRDALQQSLADQKALAKLDSKQDAVYHARFLATRRLLNRVDVVSMSREAMMKQIELMLVALFALTLITAILGGWWRQRLREAKQRREVADRLASWQEAARRHAHEIRTPLTGARLEVERLATLMDRRAPSEELQRVTTNVLAQLDRIGEFAGEYASFATVAQPVLRAESLTHLTREFCSTFANVWPNLELRCAATSSAHIALIDRDLLRQVLVNLCSNSARATPGRGSVTFTLTQERSRVRLDVADTGTGIPESIRTQLFDPYITTREIGEGMGLGLSIARKILLDHGGDLTLVSSSPAGTTFRLTVHSAEQ